MPHVEAPPQSADLGIGPPGSPSGHRPRGWFRTLDRVSRSAVDAVAAHGGVARTSALRAAGVTDAALRAAVRRGALVRARQGVYALPGTSPVILAALGCRGRLSCLSAARHHGLWTLDGGPASPPHVWIDPDRHPSSVPPGFVVHRDGRGEPDALVAVRLAHCLAQIARCAGAEAFLCAFESALRQRLLTRAELDGLRATVPAGIRPLIEIARGDADSGLETLIRYRLHLLGIECLTQVAIPGVGRVDIVVGDRLIIEADGRSHDGEGRHRDLIRDAVAATLGFTTLRFDAALILHDWPTVEAAILAVLARGDHESDFGRRVRASS